ncbi:DNA/RNA non-specific endonuclease [Streptomyces sp. NPDC101393]|uniref:DNA/RNA non-specific endonuclease n=1 Tax=Streptomyces sp. NPDC101393 TaxID=3366141 RepID=UPI00380458A9
MTSNPLQAAASRRRMVRRVILLVLVALLVPIAGTGAPASAATSTAGAPAQPGTVSPLAPPGDLTAVSAALARKVDDFNRQEAEIARQAKELVAEAERITKDAAALRTATTALNSKTTAVNQKTSNLNSRVAALNAKTSAHNSKPHTFRMPQQAAAASAYDAEASALRAEQSQLQGAKSSLQSEQNQLREQEGNLRSKKSQLSAASSTHDTKADALRSKEQQLQSLGQQLLQQMAQAIQRLADNPPDPAATMDQGGDAAAPPEYLDQTQSQEAGLADSPSRQPQVAALKAYEKQTGTTVDMIPGTAYLSPAAVRGLPASQAAQLGSPVGTYDGLARKPNGHYKALRVKTPGTSVSPRQTAFDKAIARSGQAQADVGRTHTRIVIDEVTSVEAVSTPSGPDTGTPSSSPRQGCGAGYVAYQDTDGAHGNRAQGVAACLTKEYLNSHRGTPTGSVLPAGYRWAQDFAKGKGLRAKTNINNCHLLGNKLSGSGTDRRNLATCSRGANAKQRGSGQGDDHMYSVEKQVYDAVMSGQDVRYAVTAVYDGPRTVPSGFILSVYGSYPDGRAGLVLSLPRIPNTLITGENIGTQTKDDAPTPTGSTP